MRVGLAGAGMVSHHHLVAWRAIDGATVVAIADPDRTKAEERAGEHAIPAIYDSVDAMLTHERPDAIDIAAPMETHAALVEIAADHGVAILCQKPLAPTFNEAEAVAAIASAKGVRLMVHENWRFRPHYRTITAWLQGGRIGRPIAFHLETLSASLLPRADGTAPGLVRQPFLGRMERLIVLELLVHHLDTLTALFGPLEVTSATLSRGSPLVVGEDTATLSLKTKAVAGTVFASMAAHGAPPRPSDKLTVLGEDGAIHLDGKSLTCEGADPISIDVDLEADYQASYTNALAHFADRMKSGAPFATSPQAHLAVLRLVETIYNLGGPVSR